MLAAGSVLQGRYRIERIVGEGGMGAVYLAIEVLLGGKRVAIKEMHINIEGASARQQAIDQFQKEAHILATLEHPGIVDVTHYFEQDGKQYLVMAYVDGRTLDVVVNDSNHFLPVSTVLDWMDQIADVLDYLHTHDPPIIFRDMKPTNVMLDVRNRIRLIDFGIARSFDSSKTSDIIKGAGTAGFAPLEQFGARGSSDPRTDIYAMGATLYALITRTLPPFSVDLATLDAVLVPPSHINPAIKPELELVILTMMALRKEDRYPTIAEVRQALKWARVASERPPEAPPPQQQQSAAAAPPGVRGLVRQVGAPVQKPPVANGPPARPLMANLRPASAQDPAMRPGVPVGPADEPLTVRRSRYCPRCRFVIPEGLEICPNCGVSADERKTASVLQESRVPTGKLDGPGPLSRDTASGGLRSAGPLSRDTQTPGGVRAVPKVQKEGEPTPEQRAAAAADKMNKPRVQAVVTAPSGGGFLDFLKSTPTLDQVKVVEIKPESITFESAKSYKASSTLPIKVSLEPLAEGKKPKPIVFDAKVIITTATEVPGTGWRYVATFRDMPPGVRAILESVPTSERRGAKRYRDSSQILSRELPGYKAMGVDISALGLGLLAEGGVPLGNPVELQLDLGEVAFGRDASGRVRLMSRVVHCTKRPDGRYRIGLAFVDLNDLTHEALRQYVVRL